MHVDIEGKVAVITGAGRGIGEGLAHRFSQERARLVLLERNAESLAQVAEALRGQGADVEAIHCDVSLPDQVQDAFDRAVSRFGTVHLLINNAGVAPAATVERMSVAEWEDTFANNTRSVMLCCQAAIPHFKAQRWGRVMNASSFAAIIPSHAFAAYAASKAAVNAFTRVLAAELGPWGVTVNAYAPGMVPTPLNHFAEARPERQAALLNTLAVRRWETPDDIASLLVFLSSDQAAYITGTLIDISGGKFAVQFPEIAYREAGQL